MRVYKGLSTKSVHAGEEVDPLTGSITTPIYQTSNFAFRSTADLAAVMSEEKEGYIYTRFCNPTIRVAEKKIAELESVEDAAAFSSGMAAITTAILTLVSSGDHVVSTRDIYGATFAFLDNVLPRFGVKVTFVDALKPEEMKKAITANTKLIFSESPTNPTLKIVDLDNLGRIGRERGIKTIVDSTFASPLNQQPAKHDIDAVIHSATKYLGGHNDLTGGFVCGDHEFIKKVKDNLKIFGGCIDPHCAFLLIRGMKTLAVRVEKQNINGLEVSKYLESHPKIRRVYYPGLKSHPQHRLAKRQMRGYGDVVSFELKGDLDTATRFVENLDLAYLTPSLGGTETLVTQPATTSHIKVPREERYRQGIADGLIRLSLGIEDSTDIISDLDQALAQI